ncbi:MAG: hypothetical protein M1830_003647, partial [Pleopsidium flavum]
EERFNFADLYCTQLPPILALPQQLLNFEPEWKGCAAVRHSPNNVSKTLIPVIALDPATTEAVLHMKPTPAAPGSAPQGHPIVTGTTSTVTPMILVPHELVPQTSTIPGATPITISGTPVSLGAGGLVAGDQTYAPSEWSTRVAAGDSKLTTIGGQTVSVEPAGAIAIASATLTPGAPPITVSGTPISLAVLFLLPWHPANQSSQ